MSKTSKAITRLIAESEDAQEAIRKVRAAKSEEQKAKAEHEETAAELAESLDELYTVMPEFLEVAGTAAIHILDPVTKEIVLQFSAARGSRTVHIKTFIELMLERSGQNKRAIAAVMKALNDADLLRLLAVKVTEADSAFPGVLGEASTTEYTGARTLKIL